MTNIMSWNLLSFDFYDDDVNPPRLEDEYRARKFVEKVLLCQCDIIFVQEFDNTWRSWIQRSVLVDDYCLIDNRQDCHRVAVLIKRSSMHFVSNITFHRILDYVPSSDKAHFSSSVYSERTICSITYHGIKLLNVHLPVRFHDPTLMQIIASAATRIFKNHINSERVMIGDFNMVPKQWDELWPQDMCRYPLNTITNKNCKPGKHFTGELDAVMFDKETPLKIYAYCSGISEKELVPNAFNISDHVPVFVKIEQPRPWSGQHVNNEECH
jgi:endonuclease/exonuclease/phosphatase family metal-dependent hydrolase